MERKAVTLSLKKDLYETAQDAYGKGHVSKKIEQFLADDLDHDEPVDTSPIHILQKSQLNSKQKEIVRRLIRQEFSRISLDRFNSWVEGENIYRRKDFKRAAVEKISNDPYSLYVVEDQRLVAQEFECRCGVQNFPAAFVDGCRCPGCGVEILKPFESEDFSVVGR